MRGFGVTSASFAIETHMNRVAEVLGMSPWELRLKNANRVADTSPSRVAYANPSTVTTLLGAARAAGVELPAELAGHDQRHDGRATCCRPISSDSSASPGPHLLAWRDGRPALEGGN